jgi:hypothetical protein
MDAVRDSIVPVQKVTDGVKKVINPVPKSTDAVLKLTDALRESSDPVPKSIDAVPGTKRPFRPVPVDASELLQRWFRVMEVPA